MPRAGVQTRFSQQIRSFPEAKAGQQNADYRTPEAAQGSSPRGRRVPAVGGGLVGRVGFDGLDDEASQLSNVRSQVVEAGVHVVEAGVCRARPYAGRGHDGSGCDEHRARSDPQISCGSISLPRINA